MALRALAPSSIVALLAGVAAAENQPTPTWELGYSMNFGGEGIGNQTFGQFGLRFHLGRRIVPDLAATVRIDFLSTSAGTSDNEVVGETVRVLTGLDWRVRKSKGFPIPELFVTGGMGSELTAWDRGTVHRLVSYVGFETRQHFTIPKNRAIRGISHCGWRFGLNVQVARGVEPMAIARACTLCETPDPKRGLDFGIMGYYGLDFGR